MLTRLWKLIKAVGVTTIILLVASAIVVAYYYITTPADVVVVTADSMPAGLQIKAEDFVDATVVDLQELRDAAMAASERSMVTQRPRLGTQVASRSTFTSLALRIAPFERKLHQFDFAQLRQLGISLKARRFLVIEVLGQGQDKWQFAARLKQRPTFDIIGSWDISGCPTFQQCSDEFSAKIMSGLEPRPMIRLYLSRATLDSYRRASNIFATLPTRIDPGLLSVDEMLDWAYTLIFTSEYDAALEKNRLVIARVSANDIQRSTAECNNAYILLHKWQVGSKTDRVLVQQALDAASAALKHNPQLEEAVVNWGYADYNLGKSKDALDYLRSKLPLFPKNTALLLNYGFLQYRQYLSDGSRSALREAVDATQHAWDLGQSHNAATNLGFYYYETGTLDQALHYWSEAYKLNSKDADGVAGFALALFKHGDRDLAVARFREALAMDKDVANSEKLKHDHYWSNKAIHDVLPLLNASHKP